MLTLRGRLALGFSIGLLATAVVAGITVFAIDFDSRQRNQLSRYNEQLASVLELARGIEKLQEAAARFIHLGHQSALEEVEQLYTQLSLRTGDCAGADCLGDLQSVDVDDINEHLNIFWRTFQLVVEAKAEVKSSLLHDFAKLKAAVGQHTTVSGLLEQPDSGGDYGHANSVQDHLDTLQSQLLLYFYSSSAESLDAAMASLYELQVHANKLRELGSSDPAASLDLASLRDAIAANTQRIRGYSYLINVVMVGESDELIHLADQAASGVQSDIRQLGASITRARQVFHLRLSLAILVPLLIALIFYVTVSRSVTEPLRELAAVFRRLASGSEENVDVAYRPQDEIADLIESARAFRDENVRERRLLDDYQALTATLEERVEQRTQQLKEKNAELDRLASRDALTDVFNRRVLQHTLERELMRAERYSRSLAVLMLDIDFFKGVNDNYGHAAGDSVLVNLCGAIEDSLRDSDVFGRWGGEEFLVLCPEADLATAVTVAEKTRAMIEAQHFLPERSVTVSFGVAASRADDSPESLLARADEALYRAKAEGRNRVRAEKPLMLASSN